MNVKKTFIILFSILILSVVLINNGAIQSDVAFEEIKVTAYQWEWNFTKSDLSATTNYLELNVNQTYMFNVTSLDVDHGFKINSGGVNVNILATNGIYNTAQVIFTQLGEFQAVCSIACGTGHGSMKSNLNTTEFSGFLITVTETVTTGVDTVTEISVSIYNQTIISEVISDHTITETNFDTVTTKETIIITQTAPGISWLLSLFTVITTSVIIHRRFN